MSQFMLCKSANNLTSLKCVKMPCCEIFLNKIAVELFGDNLDSIWTVTDIDSLFTQAQDKPFENTEIHSLLSNLFDVCEVIVLWYAGYYQDLDYVNTKEEFLRAVDKGVNESGMCESYLYVNCLSPRLKVK